MNAFTIKTTQIEGYPLFQVTGYFNDEAGDALLAAVDPLLAQGRTTIILDLSTCDTINSLGVSRLYILGMRVTDDYVGQILVAGLDQTKVTILSLSGVIPMIAPVPSVSEACRMLKSSGPN